MKSKLLKFMTLGLPFAATVAVVVNCKSEKKVVSQSPSDNLNPTSDPNDKTNATIKGTQDEVLDYLKKVAEEETAKPAVTSEEPKLTPPKDIKPRPSVPSRSSQFLWVTPAAAAVKPGDGYLRESTIVIPGAYPPKSLTFGGGQSAFGNNIRNPSDLKLNSYFGVLAYPFNNLGSDCAAPNLSEQGKAKAYLDQVLKPWSKGSVHVRGVYFVTEQKAIIGNDFNTTAGKKSDYFVQNINPSGGFAVFLRAESKDPNAYQDDIFNAILKSNGSESTKQSLLHVSLHVVSWGIKSPKTDSIIKNSKCTQYSNDDCSAEFSAALAALSESIRTQALPTINGVQINLGNWNEGCPAIAPVSNLALLRQ
jgi:hypothetical protein